MHSVVFFFPRLAWGAGLFVPLCRRLKAGGDKLMRRIEVHGSSTAREHP